MNINKIRSFGEWLSDKENPMDTYEGFVMENSKKLLGKKISLSYWQYVLKIKCFQELLQD